MSAAVAPDGGDLVARALGHGFGDEAVLADIDVVVPRGALTALVGASGVGKTTLLNLLGGLTQPTAGEVVRPFQRPAFVFQEPLLLPWRTARGNIAFALSGLDLTRRDRQARARTMLVKVGLGQAEAGKYPHQLSGGMKKRVALARALSILPDLLLLDEPFSALDIGLQRQMQQLVAFEVQERGVTAVLVTHDLSEAVRLADEIVVLAGRPGRVVLRHVIERPPRLRDDGFVEAEMRRIVGLDVISGAFRPMLVG